ncbi:MAG: PIN domain-containing protein [Fimbriiglobus sp.]
MAGRVIDTNKLIPRWRGTRPSPGPVRSAESARAAARTWLSLSPNDGILTPVRVEFLAGIRDKDELQWADVFLAEFVLFDGGRVLPEDWQEAERLARRVPRDGRPRGTLDCVILAICNRLNLGFSSDDTGLPRRQP